MYGGVNIAKPNSKTQEKLKVTRELLLENPDATQKEICEKLADLYGISARRGRELYKTCADSPDIVDALPVRAAAVEPINPERLPSTPEEFIEWKRWFLCSPEKKALRLMGLEDLATNGSDVAKINAIKELEEMAAEIEDYTGQAEEVLINIIGGEDDN